MFVPGGLAPAFRLHILVDRIYRRYGTVGQREARIDADIAGVRRVEAIVERRAARIGDVRDARFGRVGLAAAKLVDTLVLGLRAAAGNVAIIAQPHRTEEVAPGLVVMHPDRLEVAVSYDRLLDLAR